MFVSYLFSNLNNSSKIIIRNLNLSNKIALNSINKPKMDIPNIKELLTKLAPPLNDTRHKGQAGRIGVFGGSLEYTGAPFFAAFSALRIGADLSHVFCAKDAATVIKSYSPELIVHPLLDADGAVGKIEPWLDRLHVIVIGPGLGRESNIFGIIGGVIGLCKERNKPLVIDADGLFYISENPQILKDYPAPVVLTPNIMEFARLVKKSKSDIDSNSDKRLLSQEFLKLSDNITILCKGQQDEIFNGGYYVRVTGGGSGRRCGGQGDLLCGSLATFLTWSLSQLEHSNNNRFDHRPIVAGYSASTLTRRCNERAFEKYKRSMITSDMIKEIHASFQDIFECNH